MSRRRTLWLLLPVAAVLAWLLRPVPPQRLDDGASSSLRVVDRGGTLLREVLSTAQGRGRWVDLHDISPHVVAATLAAEDRRFYRHPGIDPIAVARAAWHNLAARRILSGASTITQQTAQLLYTPPGALPRRGWTAKALEAIRALRLELWLTKDEILTQYLNRAPYGNQLFGIEAAARAYFDKPAAHLTLAEAALLAGLPRAPTRNDPLRRFANARAAQIRVLQRLRANGGLDGPGHDAALRQPLHLVERRRAFGAPHFVEHVLRRASAAGPAAASGVLATTLDARLQRSVEALTRAHVAALEDRGVTNAAVLVLDVPSGQVRAWVGSADYFDAAHDGQVDGVLARRQPGSTLKPFTYGLALERGSTAASVLPDLPTFAATAGGDFVPENYDRRFHGPVRLRTALACSYNVPAVRVLEPMGTDVLLHRLRRAGFASLTRTATHYGLGLTLGNGDVTLRALVRAYAGLARGGQLRTETAIVGRDPGPGHAVFSPQVAFLLTDILDDDDARVPAFGRGGPLELPFPSAVKTGTSKDYRDAWCVGFTPQVAVGVWMGDFAGTPTRRVPGATGPGALWRDIMLLVADGQPPQPFAPPAQMTRATVCALSGARAQQHCPQQMREWFIDGTEPAAACDWHRDGGTVYPPRYRAWAAQRAQPAAQLVDTTPATPASDEPHTSAVAGDLAIAFPGDGDRFRLDPVLRPEFQTLRLTATVPATIGRVTWLIDGEPVATVGPPFDARWPLVVGAHTVQLVDERGARSRALRFRVLPAADDADARYPFFASR